MKNAIVLAAALAAGASCAHARGIREVSRCDEVQGEKRVECSACVVQNKADGWLGTWEYRPDAAQGSRCVRLK